MKKYAHFQNFRFVTQENFGLEKACNRGIRESVNEWVVRVDADDFLKSDFLQKMRLGMMQNPGFDFYFSKEYVEFYSESEQCLREVPEFEPSEIWERGDFFATGTAFHRSLYEQVGLYEEDVKNCGLENYNFVLRLLSKSKKGCSAAGTCFYYRRHHANMSVLKRRQIIEYGEKLLLRYGKVFKTNRYHPYQLILEKK